MCKKCLVVLLVLIGGVALAIYAWIKGWFRQPFSPTTSGSTTPTDCQFPVTLSSSPECIKQAMEKSGYLDYLRNSGNPEIAEAESDPVGTFKNHKDMLTQMYPQYFSAH